MASSNISSEARVNGPAAAGDRVMSAMADGSSMRAGGGVGDHADGVVGGGGVMGSRVGVGVWSAVSIAARRLVWKFLRRGQVLSVEM
jgi:hypothetical protein